MAEGGDAAGDPPGVLVRSGSRLSRRASIADRIVAVVSAIDVVDDGRANGADRSFDELLTCLDPRDGLQDDAGYTAIVSEEEEEATDDEREGVEGANEGPGNDDDATRGLLRSGSTGERFAIVRTASIDKGSGDDEHGPKDDYVWRFPQSWEDKLAWFDDPIIRMCQRPGGRVLHFFNIVCLALTAVETGIAVPMVLHIMGLDALAQFATFLMLGLCGVSQIPKRFIWRYRPYMVGRARKVRRDLTSSFPSRAVTCGVVYTYGAIAAYNYAHDTHVTHLAWPGFLCIVGAALLLSFTRVNMGAHYPSDCAVGMVQGTIVCAIGAGLYIAEIARCKSCLDDECYGFGVHVLRWSTLSGLNWAVVVLSSVGSVFLTVIFVAKPIRFWVKCHHAFGMLFPCVVFQIVFLCRPNTRSDVALPSPHSPAWYAYVYAIGAAAFCTVIGMRVKGATHRTVVAYVVMFVFGMVGLACWRLGVD